MNRQNPAECLPPDLNNQTMKLWSCRQLIVCQFLTYSSRPNQPQMQDKYVFLIHAFYPGIFVQLRAWKTNPVMIIICYIYGLNYVKPLKGNYNKRSGSIYSLFNGMLLVYSVCDEPHITPVYIFQIYILNTHHIFRNVILSFTLNNSSHNINKAKYLLQIKTLKCRQKIMTVTNIVIFNFGTQLICSTCPIFFF